MLEFVCESKKFKFFMVFTLTNLMTELNGGGPLLEYERRVAAGELMDGDACQVF